MTDEKEPKPVTSFAAPPVSAVVSITGFAGVSLYTFPSMEHQDAAIFTNRVFPELLSPTGLLYLRLFFAAIGFVGFACAWWTPPVTVKVPYRPKSKVARIPFTLAGWRKQFPFTSWSWNVLAMSFALSSYIGYQVDQGQAVAPWAVHLGLLLWEIAAPMTLLIAAVVKYALWPAQIKETGNGAAFLTARALLQHNANVMMAVTEVALMGGLPVRFSHISISVLYGCSYVLFTWAIQMVWHGQGPAFIYFFMDTTLGNEHTLALFVLLSFLMAFHGLFCGIESLLHMVGNSVWSHAAFTLVLCSLVCRFRD